jgi:hypothetical protein
VFSLGVVLDIQGKLFRVSRNILIVHNRLTIAPGAGILGEGRGWHVPVGGHFAGFLGGFTPAGVPMGYDGYIFDSRWILMPWLRNHRIPCFCILPILLPGFKSRLLEPRARYSTMAKESQRVFSREMTEKSKRSLSICLCAIILLSPINTEP